MYKNKNLPLEADDTRGVLDPMPNMTVVDLRHLEVPHVDVVVHPTACAPRMRAAKEEAENENAHKFSIIISYD